MRGDVVRRRRAGFAVVVLVAVAVVALVLRPVLAGGADRYRVDVIFDVARGIGPGQVVKVAGAEVGEVTGVRITADNRARVELAVDRRFAPFKRDARCAIQPEGLISENFVGCSPGSAQAPVLGGDGEDATPTVGVARTSAPVSLQDLFDVWNVPTSQRLGVLVSDLGLGMAARGEDVNAILARANPALTQARRAIRVVNRQKRQLQDLVTRADPVIGALADRSPDVQRFIAETTRLTRVTAGSREGLRATSRELPPLLREARPALAQLEATAQDAMPLLRTLRSAAPDVAAAARTVPATAADAAGALRALDGPARRTRTALRALPPVGRRLRTFAAAADPAGRDLNRLLVSLRDAGGIENLLRGFYAAAGVTNSYDSTSHILLGNLSVNQCVAWAQVPTPGCDAHLDGGEGLPEFRSVRRERPSRERPVATPTATPPAAPAPASPGTPVPTAAPTTPAPTPTAQPAMPRLPGLDELLPGRPGPTATPSAPLTDVLDALLGR